MAKSRVVWSEEQQRFVPVAERGLATERDHTTPPPAEATRVTPRPRPEPAVSRPLPEPRARRRPSSAHTGAPDTSDDATPARPKRGRRARRLLLVVIVVAVALVVGVLALGWVQFHRLERVPVGDALSPAGGGGTNYLIVGSDSRENIDRGDPNAGAFVDGSVSGARTDTIMVLRVERDRSQLLSIPRDLWVQNPDTGEYGRINATYQTSPATLIRTVQQQLGIPIHHYLEIDFPSFGALVDAVGGISVNFEHPARDTNSGLDVAATGPVTLDGEQALAYVRSRHYTEQIDGQWVADPTADLGRTERQRAFLTALMTKLGSTRNPLALRRIGSGVSGGLAIDDRLTYWNALALAWKMKGFHPESVALPVYGRTTSGGAAVLELQQPTASEVLGQFGAG